MRVARARLRDKAIALRVHFFHVGPPTQLISLVQVVMNARLPQVFLKNVFALDPIEVVPHVVRRAVLATRNALLILEVLRAAFARPRDLPRAEMHVPLQLLGILVELLDEVQGTLIVRGVPELNEDVVGLLLDAELGG